jgi:hypothetical protein
MAKVFGFIQFELLPNVSPADYEAFVAQASAGGFDRPGMVFHFVKADRGERKGRYAFLFEFEDVVARNRLFPVEGSGTPDEVLAEKLKVMLGGMRKLTGPFSFTDYVHIG